MFVEAMLMNVAGQPEHGGREKATKIRGRENGLSSQEI